MAVRAITFDFWCTLFADREERISLRRQIRVEAFCAVTGADPERAIEAHDHAAQVFHRHHVEQQQTLGPPDALRIMAAYCAVEVDATHRRELEDCFAAAILNHAPEPLDGALDAVRAAAALGPVGLISDAGLSPGRSLRALLDRHGFTPYFRHMTFSDEVGVAKPQPPMFANAALGLGVAEAEILHLGDLEPTDIAGALGVGARAALFTGHHDKYRVGTQAHHTIGSWPEFVRRLDALVAE